MIRATFNTLPWLQKLLAWSTNSRKQQHAADSNASSRHRCCVWYTLQAAGHIISQTPLRMNLNASLTGGKGCFITQTLLQVTGYEWLSLEVENQMAANEKSIDFSCLRKLFKKVAFYNFLHASNGIFPRFPCQEPHIWLCSKKQSWSVLQRLFCPGIYLLNQLVHMPPMCSYWFGSAIHKRNEVDVSSCKTGLRSISEGTETYFCFLSHWTAAKRAS